MKRSSPHKGITSGLFYFTSCLYEEGKEREAYYSDGSIALLRSYWKDIVEPLEALPGYCRKEVISTLRYGPHEYPLYVLRCGSNLGNPWIWLSGIVHGDEDAGGKAILEFLQGDIEPYLDTFNFLIVPCVNPSGYETLSLQSINAYHTFLRSEKNAGNLNRLFGTGSDQQEVRAIEVLLKKQGGTFLFAMDLHESSPYYTDETYSALDAPRGCWLYESCDRGIVPIGDSLLQSLPSCYEVCKMPQIYDDQAKNGVIAETTGHAELGDMTSLDSYLFRHYTQHSFTTETPTGWRLEDRIAVQKHLINEVLRCYTSSS